jgi:enoyl-CoA hydratase/carnithine racemase
VPDGVIRWESREHVGIATIDRPDRRNALNAELADELRGHLTGEESRGLRAVVVTGEGKAFCAGADLARRFDDVATGDGASTDSFRPAFELLLDAIVDHPAPVIAAINGHALGAGLQLAVACDLRVVQPGAQLGIPASKLGVLLSAANITRLAVLVGQATARDLLFAGRSVDADEALRVGLVHQVVDDARAAGVALATELASLAPLTIQGHKRALNLVARRQALDDASRAEIAALEARAFASADLQEGLAAFAEKRAARFEGR